MVSDPIGELQDLAVVHEFYLELLEQLLGHPIPVPSDVTVPEVDESWIVQSVITVKSWLALLDLAISPRVMREGVKNRLNSENNKALLRYFFSKTSAADSDRDKADFLTTQLFRKLHIMAGNAIATSEDRETQCREFSGVLESMLGDVQIAPLTDECQQLLQGFQALHRDAERYSTFDQLTDSGIVKRGRALKQSFGTSFCHPEVLAASAVYNVYFGERFNRLFRDAASQIRTFNARWEEGRGGRTSGLQEEEITVRRLLEKESKVLNEEYAAAQDNFRSVSKFQKVVDDLSRKSGMLEALQAAKPVPPVAPLKVAPQASAEDQPAKAADFPSDSLLETSDAPLFPPAQSSAARASTDMELERRSQVCTVAELSTTDFNHIIDESKIMVLRETIRQYVRGADPKQAAVVPLPNGRIVMTQAEVDAFRADYYQEKSFRGEYISKLMYFVSLGTRINEELETYNTKLHSLYLWKPHADSLAYLLSAGLRAVESSEPVLKMAVDRGLTEKASILQGAMQKHRNQALIVAQALQRTINVFVAAKPAPSSDALAT